LQLCVLRLGFLQDGNVGVGVFPEGEEIFVGGTGFGVVSGERISSAELEMGECAEEYVSYGNWMR
jgi:hypothetical protein